MVELWYKLYLTPSNLGPQASYTSEEHRELFEIPDCLDYPRVAEKMFLLKGAACDYLFISPARPHLVIQIMSDLETLSLSFWWVLVLNGLPRWYQC